MNQRIAATCFALWLLVAAHTASAATLSGKVLDYYGTAPVAGAKVQAIEVTGSDTTLYQTTSGADGAYSLTVPAATFVLAANANATNTRYIAQYYGGVNSVDNATRIDAQLGDQSGLTFYLYSGFELSGTIRMNGSPIGADIYIYDSTMGYVFTGALGPAYDVDSGQFKLYVSQGVYSALIYPEGDIYPTEVLAQTVNADVLGLAINVVTDASIGGTVFTSALEPLQYASVTAIDAINGLPYNSVYAGQDGAYTIPHLPPDRSYILLAAASFNSQEASQCRFYPEAVTPEAAATVHITQGETRMGIDIVMGAPGGGTISGTVKDQSGRPIEGVLVYDFYASSRLSPVYPFAQRLAYTDADGKYALTTLAPVEAGVAVIADGYVPQIWNHHNETTTLALADIITIQTDVETAGIDFDLRSTAGLADAPVVTAISPHLLLPGTSADMTITGNNFASSARVELLAATALHIDGSRPSLSSVQIISGQEIWVSVTVPGDAHTGPWYIGITNPDGQYVTQAFVVIPPASAPETGIIAAPYQLIDGSTMTASIDVVNFTGGPRDVDLYVGFLVGDEAFFYDGRFFNDDPEAIAANVTLPNGFFVPVTTLLALPVADAPGGVRVTWFSGLLNPATFEVYSLHMSEISL